MGWRQSVVTASLIIVYGTGANTGLFVYNGTPALGNPPIFWASSATSDPFGNALPSTAGVQGTGTFSAGHTIINASGEFVYSGTPALGNLIASLAPASGFDTPGNLFLAGNVGYTFIGAEPAYYAVQSSTNGIAIFRATAESGPWTQMGGIAYVHGGFQGIQTYDQASGASLTMGDSVDAGGNVFGALAGVLSLYPVVGAVTATPAGNGLVYASVNGTPFGQTTHGLPGSLALVQTDTNTHTLGNSTTPANLTKAWVIPANDPQVGTIYAVEVPVNGTYEANQLNIGINLDGSFTNVVPILSTFVTAGHNVVGMVKMKLTIQSTGAGGTVDVDFGGTLEDSTVARSATTATGTNGRHAALAIDTTSAHSFAIAASWGGTTAGQTISGTSSDYTRSGP